MQCHTQGRRGTNRYTKQMGVDDELLTMNMEILKDATDCSLGIVGVSRWRALKVHRRRQRQSPLVVTLLACPRALHDEEMTLAGKTGKMLSMEVESDADPDHEPENLPGPSRLALGTSPSGGHGGGGGGDPAEKVVF